MGELGGALLHHACRYVNGAGRECDLDKVYPAYILISKLYKLR